MARRTNEDLAQWQNQTPEDVWREMQRARVAEARMVACLRDLLELYEPVMSDNHQRRIKDVLRESE